jgi:hypothetical protein
MYVKENLKKNLKKTVMAASLCANRAVSGADLTVPPSRLAASDSPGS